MIEAISKLRESTSVAPSTVQSTSSEESNVDLPEYDDALAELGHSIKALRECNRLFRDALTPHEFIELNGEEEGEGEEVTPRTDEEIVEEITRVKGRLDGR